MKVLFPYQGSSLADIHVVGFSLGAHVAGWVGSAITTGKLARITGNLTDSKLLEYIDDV